MIEIETSRQIGAVVRSERTRQGLTQQQLAESADVSRALISRLEKGTATALYPEKLLAILDALGLSLFIAADDPDASVKMHPDSSAKKAPHTTAGIRRERMLVSRNKEKAFPNLLANANRVASPQKRQIEPTASPNGMSLSAAEATEQLASAAMSFNFSKTSSLLAPREGGEEK